MLESCKGQRLARGPGHLLSRKPLLMTFLVTTSKESRRFFSSSPLKLLYCTALLVLGNKQTADKLPEMRVVLGFRLP